MLLSRTAKYGIKALTFLAEIPEEEYRTAETAAEKTDAPADFLRKIFQELAEEGLLESQRGRGGGFRLSGRGQSVSLLEIIKVIEGEGVFDRCLFDLKECGQGGTCPIHEEWRPIRDQIVEMLEEVSVADLAYD